MADSQRGRTASRSSRSTTWDPRNPINWTVTKLHEELDRMGIYAPVSLGKVTLRKLYLENVERNRPARNGSERDAAHRDTDSSPPTTTTSVPEINTNTRTIANTVTSSAGAVGNELITRLVSSVHTMQQTMMGLQQSVLKLASERNKEDGTVHTLETATQAFQNSNFNTVNSSATGGYRLRTTEFGVPLENLPHIDVVPERLKKNIWEGKDINLATLLIPKVEKKSNEDMESNGHNITINLNNEDPRLLKSLTLSEFITAFGKYKRVMFMKYHERRIELDRYEANIVDIANVYGNKFYDYHCQFSARAASALRDNNIKVDWSIRDLSLLHMVTSNARVNECFICNSTMHATDFCPSKVSQPHHSLLQIQNQPQRKGPSTSKDKYGRPRVVYNNKELCNNYNANKCTRNNCPYAHMCSSCFSSTHGATTCKNATSNVQSSKQ